MHTKQQPGSIGFSFGRFWVPFIPFSRIQTFQKSGESSPWPFLVIAAPFEPFTPRMGASPRAMGKGRSPKATFFPFFLFKPQGLNLLR
jgi:hypothetical protein